MYKNIQDYCNSLKTQFEFIPKERKVLLEKISHYIAKGSKEQGMFAGLAIGGTVLLEAMFAGPVSGASMNPIRSLAPAIVSGHVEHLWIYLLAPVTGAILAVMCWSALKLKQI